MIDKRQKRRIAITARVVMTIRHALDKMQQRADMSITVDDDLVQRKSLYKFVLTESNLS
jgi:hypothetical protein